jgi:hypothetical protein
MDTTMRTHPKYPGRGTVDQKGEGRICITGNSNAANSCLTTNLTVDLVMQIRISDSVWN